MGDSVRQTEIIVAAKAPRKFSFDTEVRVRVGGDYYLQEPSDDVVEPLPLLLFLHGMFQADKLFELEAPPRIASERGLPMIVLSPLCGEMRWDIDTVLGLLEHICEQYPVNSRRIYLSGVSIGGLATWELALRRPNQFAAIAPVCGAGQPWNAFRISHIPTWIFHGEQDEIVPVAVSSEMAQALQASGGTPRVTIYPDEGHSAWGRAYSDPSFWEWLTSQEADA